MDESCREGFTALARAVLGIRAIFGSDLASPQMAAVIGGHLRGLLGGDPRAYLEGLARHE